MGDDCALHGRHQRQRQCPGLPEPADDQVLGLLAEGVIEERGAVHRIDAVGIVARFLADDEQRRISAGA